MGSSKSVFYVQRLTRDGNLIAIKKLYAKSTQGKTKFMNEVNGWQMFNTDTLQGCQDVAWRKMKGCLCTSIIPTKVWTTFSLVSYHNILICSGIAEEVTNVLRIGMTDPEKCRELD